MLKTSPVNSSINLLLTKVGSQSTDKIVLHRPQGSPAHIFSAAAFQKDAQQKGCANDFALHCLHASLGLERWSSMST